MSALLLRGIRTLPTTEQGRPVEGNLLVKGSRIAYLGKEEPRAERTMDLNGALIIPGLVQTHVHLCQTLLRGLAEERALLAWLKDVVWPMEAAMDEEDVYLSSLLGCAELLAGGTTTVLDMGPARHTEAVFEACRTSGIRATTGNSLMDSPEAAKFGLAVPYDEAREEADRLIRHWHGAAGGRLGFCYAPRFPLGCSHELLTGVATEARKRNLIIHTHLAESEEEERAVRDRLGVGSTGLLERAGVLGPRTVVAHGVHTGPSDWDVLARTGTQVAHCPSSNLKLSSGVAPVAELVAHGVGVGLGADGAPCNNRLDAFEEMRLCALLGSLKSGPRSITAWDVLRMGTIGGAACLGRAGELGSLKVGKKADLIGIDLSGYHCLPSESVDPATVIVFSARASDVVLTMVDGEVLYTREGGLTRISRSDLQSVSVIARRLVARAEGTAKGE